MRLFGLILLVFVIASCQEEVNLPLATIKGEVPVIEGVWTDNNFYNEVKVSLAKNYLDTTENLLIKNAEVTISTADGSTVFPFRFFEESGSYRAQRSGAVGVIGETYQLNVQWDDYEFQSEGILLPPPILDSLTYKYEEERLFRDEGYYIKVYGKIPYEEDNYYRIRVIENDTLKDRRSDYLLFDDTFGLKFFENGLELGYAFDAKDTVQLELYRMNKKPYNYFVQLVNLFYSDGGLFSPPPQNPETNIEDLKGDKEVVGYFSVMSVLREKVIIEPENE
ncbi:DUF4249 family protein [Algoriphagus sp. NG3]|uniref:DUF4249 family protein n=1 Tax=Algoriphagus sp. NG3 TaxID=3097546 RepID=UPI002A833C83|nr:DUF4249 family protein [Algoriphagus sp. NG3]WPR77561.1 DUF4249 family protein [Algoriphagus sp. NG3]